MAQITVNPATFALVHYDHDEIFAIVARVADVIGFPADVPITLDVNESTPLGRVHMTSLDPIGIAAEGGAFEDPRRPRRMSEDNTVGALSKVLYRIHDRRFGSFGDAPDDATLSLGQSVAWDIYSVGRCERAGFPVQRQRRLYAFRNRHGFSDAADAVFERLWHGEDLSWADVNAMCGETAAAR